ncbi:MAG TPA: serine/threonine-protein kinase, partial [Allocoleopsis sp.]
GDFFLVQDFIDGKDLSAEIIDNKHHNQFYVINLLKSVLVILDFIHNNGVIHRDIKPSNLMRFKHNKKIMLIDFGAVKEISTLNNNTSATIIGTDGYRPREQEIGKPEFCSDIYALGMVAIYALTGIRPDLLPRDPNQNYSLIWRDRLRQDYVYYPELLDVIDKMVKFDSSERYQSAKEVLTALNHLSIPVFDRFKNFILSPIGLSSSGLILIGIILMFWLPKPLKCKFENYKYQNVVLNYNIKVCHPDTWQKQSNINVLGEVAKFLPPTDNNKTIFENVMLTVEPNPKLTLDQYAKEVMKTIKNNPGSEINQPIDITMNNRPGKKIIFEILEDEQKVKRMQIFVFKNNQVYILTYSAEPENFDKYLREVDLMMNNLEILD